MQSCEFKVFLNILSLLYTTKEINDIISINKEIYVFLKAPCTMFMAINTWNLVSINEHTSILTNKRDNDFLVSTLNHKCKLTDGLPQNIGL